MVKLLSKPRKKIAGSMPKKRNAEQVEGATKKASTPKVSKVRLERSVAVEPESKNDTTLASGSKKVGETRKKPGARTSKSQANPRFQATFANAELESDFIHFCQLVTPEQKDAAELFLAVKTHHATKIEFMANNGFLDSGIEARLFPNGSLLPFTSEELQRVRTPDLPAHLARLCETKLLTPEEEHLTFLRMNYLRFQAEQIRSQLPAIESMGPILLAENSPAAQTLAWSLRRIEALLKAADWHRDRMVKSNMRLVISIVKKFVNAHNGFDDLLSDGIIALMRAVDKFDVGLGFRFSTYATQVVRRNSYRRVMEKQKERQRVTLSVHDPGVDISDEHRSSGMSETRWEALRSRLGNMLDRLDRREKLIIRARFSLGGHRRVQTLQKLADRLGVSKERIRQLEKRALDKLRDMADLSPIPEVEV